MTPAPCANINGSSPRSRRTAASRLLFNACLPIVVREGGEASAWCRRPADIVDQDVDAAEAIPHRADDLLRTLGRAEVGCHEQLRLQAGPGGWIERW